MEISKHQLLDIYDNLGKADLAIGEASTVPYAERSRGTGKRHLAVGGHLCATCIKQDSTIGAGIGNDSRYQFAAPQKQEFSVI